VVLMMLTMMLMKLLTTPNCWCFRGARQRLDQVEVVADPFRQSVLFPVAKKDDGVTDDLRQRQRRLQQRRRQRLLLLRSTTACRAASTRLLVWIGFILVLKIHGVNMCEVIMHNLFGLSVD